MVDVVDLLHQRLRTDIVIHGHQHFVDHVDNAIRTHQIGPQNGRAIHLDMHLHIENTDSIGNDGGFGYLEAGFKGALNSQRAKHGVQVIDQIRSERARVVKPWHDVIGYDLQHPNFSISFMPNTSKLSQL